VSSSLLPQPHPSFLSYQEGCNWYALATMSRHERFVAHQLEGHRLSPFLPSKIEIHRWSDRRKRVEVPLFPGYVFLHVLMSAEIRRMATCLRGSVGFVTMHGQPVPIPHEQIETVQKLVVKNVPCAAYGYLKTGQRVRICSGALNGTEGLLLRIHGNKKLVISIDGISRSLAVHIDGYDIEAV